MKKIKLTNKQIIETKERLIIENFHRVSKQLGILTEEQNLAKYAIYAEPYSYLGAKYGYFNKKLNKFIPNKLIKNYPKEEFICNIDDVKIARNEAPKDDFNPNNITWEQFHKFEDRFYRQYETGMMVDEKWASDGGYYNKPERDIVISREEYENYKKAAESIFNALNGLDGNDGICIPNNLYEKGIIKVLFKNSLLDYDSEEGQNFYWLRNPIDDEELRDEIELSMNALFDRVEKNISEDGFNKNIMSLEDAKILAQDISDKEGGVAQHVNKIGVNQYIVSDFFDSDKTVASYGAGIYEESDITDENTKANQIIKQLEPHKDFLRKSVMSGLQHGLPTTSLMLKLNLDALYIGIEIPSPDNFYSKSKNPIMEKVLNWLGFKFTDFGVVPIKRGL